jgi:hypothetical protein
MENFKIHNSKFCGELSDSLIEMNFIKFKRVLESIKQFGLIYDKGDYDKGLISGFFLINNDDFKFIVTRGIHRTYVMKYLNIKDALFEIDKEYTPVINIKDLDNWYFVKNNIIDKNLAINLFNSFF